MQRRALIAALALSSALFVACGNNSDLALVEVSGAINTNPAQEIRTVEEIVEDEFPIKTEVDKTLEPGAHKIVQQGERGQSKVTYEITFENGVEVARKAISEEVIKKPVEAIVKIGPTTTAEKDGETAVIGYSDPASNKVNKTTRDVSQSSSRVASNILRDKSRLEKPGDKDRTANATAKPSKTTGSATTSKPKPANPTTPPHTEKPNVSKPGGINVEETQPTPETKPNDGGVNVEETKPAPNPGDQGPIAPPSPEPGQPAEPATPNTPAPGDFIIPVPDKQ